MEGDLWNMCEVSEWRRRGLDGLPGARYCQGSERCGSVLIWIVNISVVNLVVIVGVNSGIGFPPHIAPGIAELCSVAKVVVVWRWAVGFRVPLRLV